MGPLTKLILESEGYPTSEDGLLSLMQYAMDNDCPGICMVCRTVEPDARQNVCEACGAHMVLSLLVLLGII